MAEHLSINSPTSDFEQADYSHDSAFLLENLGGIQSIQPITVSDKDILDEDPDRLLKCFEKYGEMSFKQKGLERREGASFHESNLRYNPQFAFFAEDNIKPSLHEVTRRNELGLIELDMQKLLERQVSLLNRNEKVFSKSTSQKEIDIQSLKEKVAEYSKRLEEAEDSAKQTDPEKSRCTEKQKIEFTTINYEEKDKLKNRKPLLREMDREFTYLRFIDEGLETFDKDLINHVELSSAVNILRRIAYTKLCEKHFSSEFPAGAFAEEDEPIENISISVNNFEFLHKELPINFLDLFKREDFDSWASNMKKDPQINNIVPSFSEFLQSDSSFQFPVHCITLILAVLQNPYHKLEVFYDDELPAVNEQMIIAEYLVNCLLISKILDDENAYEKLSEAIIRFANIYPSFLAHILEGFKALLSSQIDNNIAYKIYCKVLNLMNSIGATIINLCLPQHFEKVSFLAAGNRNCDLYFHLLRACEISIANAVEFAVESSDDVNMDLFYNTCYSYFGCDLTTRLIPVFNKYEERKNREEQYLCRKHGIIPTKDGYMNLEMRFLINRNKKRTESKASNFPAVNKGTFKEAGKILLSSSNGQLGYVIQDDMNDLSEEDFDYWTTMNEFGR